MQTDDRIAVERAVTAYAPRIGSRGHGSRAGRRLAVIYDEVCDPDPTALLRYAREVSSRLGAVVLALSLELDAVVRHDRPRPRWDRRRVPVRAGVLRSRHPVT